jgi:hypothetical protein
MEKQYNKNRLPCIFDESYYGVYGVHRKQHSGYAEAAESDRALDPIAPAFQQVGYYGVAAIKQHYSSSLEPCIVQIISQQVKAWCVIMNRDDKIRPSNKNIRKT